ncbi:hypothetical protein [Micromonospora echinofusca]|uniref:hypothetical protein n=1 Tax=Micromonospora echinofusca TaxID=47858 RepID=UPI0033D13A9A
MHKRWWSLAAVSLLAAVALVAPASPAMAAPTFKVPFPCGQSWSGQTRTNHSPTNAIDFNRTDDLGDPVVASAPGTVSGLSSTTRTAVLRRLRTVGFAAWLRTL